MDDFYSKKSVLITGATGFIGLALIEKLLRCFPDIENIFLLLRPKRGSDIYARLEELKKNKVFDNLRASAGNNVLDKLIVINGDVNYEDLALDIISQQLLPDVVNVVFHCAATLDFDANLVTAVNTNLLGTRRLIDFCKTFKHLQAFVHVSSAYVNSTIQSADEKLYPAPADANQIIQLIGTVDDATVDLLTPSILKDHPNTYTFTKSLAEFEVAKAYGFSFPASIIRPSMIVGSWKEPTAGWTVSKNGPQGFIMGALKGVVRRLPININHIYDYIPADVVINYMLVSAFHTALKPPPEVPIYHVTSSTSNPFQWNMIDNEVNSFLHEYPLQGALWYPTLKFLPSLELFYISACIFHFLPAAVLDALTKLFGGRPILLRLHRNINRSLGRLSPFIFKQWLFDNTQALSLRYCLSAKDNERFYLSIDDLLWPEYFKTLVIGVRTYLHHESLDNLASAKKKDRIYRVLNLALQLIVVGLLWILVTYYCHNGSFFYSSWILVVVFIIDYIL